MDTIKIERIDEVYIKIHCDPNVAHELNDYFTFDVPGAKFMPAFRNKVWDGKIRLFQIMNGYLYGGLVRYVEEFCKSRKYDIEYLSNFTSKEFSIKEAKDFITKIKPRTYRRFNLKRFLENLS